MEFTKTDVLWFFEGKPKALALYEALEAKVLAAFPQTRIRVTKTQISFSNRHLYACVSLLPVRKKAGLPEAYIVITLGLPYSLESPRVAAKTQPYPGRWTTHILISSAEEIDEELGVWVRQAYCFAQSK